MPLRGTQSLSSYGKSMRKEEISMNRKDDPAPNRKKGENYPNDKLQDITAPITDLIRRMQQDDEAGRSAARSRLWDIIYPILKQKAVAMLKNDPVGGVIHPSDLMQEAYFKLAAREKMGWNDRTHLYWFAVQAMRNLVIDAARGRARRDRFLLPVDDLLGIEFKEDDASVIEVEEVLKMLEAADPLKGRIVAMRFYGGGTNEMIAEQLGISVATVKRHLKVARAFILSKIRPA
jgi:RNA polymerase sigma factor (TIGR02999 family)